MSETDGGFDWETLTYSEAAPDGQPADGSETEEDAATAETTADGRARDEKGRFLPADETPEDQAERLLAGKYKDPEQLERAYLEAQQLIGSLRSDQGEIRSQLEQLQATVQQAKPQPVQNFEQLLEEDPKQAAIYALTMGDQQAYQYAKAQWDLLSPGTPDIWEQNLTLQQQMQQLEAKISGVAAPIAEQQNLRVVADAYRGVQQANPDFEQLQPAMSEVVDELAASGYDWVSPALESGDPKQVSAALNTVVQLARARASGNLADQARVAAQHHVAATEQAKREAIVGSASTSMSEPPSKTPGQALAEGWREHDISALKYDN